MEVLTNARNSLHNKDEPGTELSLKGLAVLVRRVLKGTASADECELFAFLSGPLLEGSISSARLWSSQFDAVMREFFRLGNVAAAAQRCQVPERTAYEWVTKYAEFAGKVKASRSRRDAADVACALICDRKAQHKPSFGPEAWNSREVTREEPRGDGGQMCSGCPRRQG